MVVTDALGGMIDSRLSFHYDIGNDVLYVRRFDSRERECIGEETPDGIVLRDSETDEIVGWTAVNWWKHEGSGPVPDSINGLTRRIGIWAQARLAS